MSKSNRSRLIMWLIVSFLSFMPPVAFIVKTYITGSLKLEWPALEVWNGIFLPASYAMFGVLLYFEGKKSDYFDLAWCVMCIFMILNTMAYLIPLWLMSR